MQTPPSTALPDLPAAPRRAKPLNVDRRPAPAGWPFGELTDQQRHQRALLEIKARAGALRGLPSCFGALA